MSEKNCQYSKECPSFNANYKICTETSGIVGNHVAPCLVIYEKNKSRIKKIK